MANALFEYYKPEKTDEFNLDGSTPKDGAPAFSIKNSLAPDIPAGNVGATDASSGIALTDAPATSIVEPSKNALLTPFKAKTKEEIEAGIGDPLPPVIPPPDNFVSTWGQKIGYGDYKVPLDTFVRVAGMAANALAPNSFGGRLGKGMEQMGHEAMTERAHREYVYPNELLNRRLRIAQIKNAELRETPTEWKVFYESQLKQGVLPDKIVENWRTMHQKGAFHYLMNEQGQVSVYKDGKLQTGPGNGKDVTKDVAFHTVDDAGTVHGFNKSGKEVLTTPAAGRKTKPSTNVPASNKIRWQRTNAAGQTVNTYQDGSSFVVQADGSQKAATAEDLKGLTLVAAPPKGKGSNVDKLKNLVDKDKKIPTVFENKKTGEKVKGYKLNGKNYKENGEEL